VTLRVVNKPEVDGQPLKRHNQAFFSISACLLKNHMVYCIDKKARNERFLSQAFPAQLSGCASAAFVFVLAAGKPMIMYCGGSHMKSKLLLALAAFAMVFGVTAGAQAQYAVTNDVIFVNLGYIPNYTASYDVSGADDLEFMGFAAMGEYNLNLGAVWIGFGLEYQYLVDDEAEGGTEP
jgi:hypothetical protein